MATSASSNFFGTFLGASVLRQDPRFFPQSHPTFWGSIKYSARRLVVTRSDSGNDVFNASGLIGPLAGETLANTYLPKTEQTGAKTGERYGIDLAWKFAGNMFKNYWPTIFRDMGLNHLGVIPNPASVRADRRANEESAVARCCSGHRLSVRLIPFPVACALLSGLRTGHRPAWGISGPCCARHPRWWPPPATG